MLAALHNRITELSQAQPVTALCAVARLQDTAPALAVDAVRAARQAMVTWEAVGAALGCSRQSAHERFVRHATD
ncbi:helix-turn-helix domain-containing protein [Streptomyces katrae]|uniref:Helix-turn-helix domain-containing protein n=1 Tax=Streptomyces katrae TaxID=68223 RepID=A0ABT7GTC8_9ACTN|nr:helix-turn-helix domain-containing protein [Streptomyces katrae]MDK9496174.1 helix-turn-helix domain-containing protein [Streptomyces katrae]